MVEIPGVKFDKSIAYLTEQLNVQSNNKQLLLDIITNLSIMNDNSYSEIVEQANFFLQEVSQNITSIQQLSLEISNITRDLNDESLKKNKSKEFYISFFSNIKHRVENYTFKFQDLERKLESDNYNFNKFINDNDFKYNIDATTNTYSLTSFEVNNAQKVVKTRPTSPFVNHEQNACPEGMEIYKLTLSQEELQAQRINDLTKEFKDLLTNASKDSLSNEDATRLIGEFLQQNPLNPSEISDEDLEAALTNDDLIEALLEEDKTQIIDTFNYQYLEIESQVVDLIKNKIEERSNAINTSISDKLIDNSDIFENQISNQDNYVSNITLNVNDYTPEAIDDLITPDIIDTNNVGVDNLSLDNLPTAFDSIQFITDLISIPEIEVSDEELADDLLLEALLEEEEKVYDDFYDEFNDLRNSITKAEKNNKVLLISEKTLKIYLPYSVTELEDYLETYPTTYSSIQDVVEQEFIFPYNYFTTHPSLSRFKEAYLLIRDREEKDVTEAIKYATKISKMQNVNAAIIAACKTKNELDSYIYYLNDNNLDGFKFFDIIYEKKDSNKLPNNFQY